MKTGYKLLCDVAREEAASVSNSENIKTFWSGLWKLKIPGKVKHFLLKACTNSFSTKTNLLKRKILSDPTCHLCGCLAEDVMHALWECEAVKSVWRLGFGWVNRFEAAQGTFTELFGRLMTQPRAPEIFATTAWFLWSHRNKTR